MKDREFDDALDEEMDERLTRFAAGMREPALPDDDVGNSKVES